MNAILDQDPIRTERAKERDARLEAEIEAVCKRALRSATPDRETDAAMTELSVLLRQRSTVQQIALEFQRRQLLRNAK